jgi:glycosyltransferase involved in cell wall biosynthesis
MKILIATPNTALLGGIAKYYEKIREHFTADVTYFFVGRQQADAGRMARAKGTILGYARFAAAVARGGYDLVVVNPSLSFNRTDVSLAREGLLLILAKTFGVPVLVFFRGWDLRTEALLDRRAGWPFRFIYGRADAYIVLARAFRAAIQRWRFQAPVFVETTCVDDDFFDEALAADRSSRKSDRFQILFLGRIVPEKGVFEALATYRLLKATHPTVTLTVVGDGPALAEARAYVREHQLADVAFPGFLEGAAKRAAFAAADVYLFPSFWPEGMPNAVLEAMASGTPVVARLAGGLTDFFEDGRMGFSTESGDPAVYADLVERLIADPDLRTRIGTYNRAYARERFAASAVAARLEAICRSVVDQTSARGSRPMPAA